MKKMTVALLAVALAACQTMGGLTVKNYTSKSGHRVVAAQVSSLDTIRTDVVGSLLRPAAWRTARAQFDEGRLGAEEFRRIEDDAIRGAIALQESVGLDVVTDGEIRRLNFQDSFGAAVQGFAAAPSTLRGTEQRAKGG